MSSKTYVLNLGESLESLTDLRAQIRNSAGANSGAAIASGFSNLGGGSYQFTTDISTSFQGSIAFYSAADSANTLLAFAINSGSSSQPDASGNPDTVTAYLYYFVDGTPTQGAKLYYQQLADASESFEDDVKSTDTDSNGYAGFEAVLGGTYRYWINNGRFRTVTIDEYTPDPYQLPDVAG